MKKEVEWLKNRVLFIFSFLSSDLAVYSGSMSFLSVFTFIPFMMLGVFAAVNISFFAEYFDSFRQFLYSNLFADSAESIVYYINIFLQNSEKLGVFGVIFAAYSVFIFIKQLDYCIYKLAGIDNPPFGFSSFVKYLLVFIFAIFSVSVSAIIEAIGSFIGFNFIASFAAGLQMWFAMFLLFFVAIPTNSSAKRAAFFSFLCAAALSLFKKLFIYYIIFSGSYSTIYGSFAVLFLFFVWLNFSWYIFFVSVKMYLHGSIIKQNTSAK